MIGFQIITVSGLNRVVKSVLDSQEMFGELYVRGEISNLHRHYESGHIYFTLRDKTASVKAVMFRTYAEGLRFSPENGMKVILRANLSVYERDGIYQLYVQDMQPDGVGALHLSYKQVYGQLENLGLFDPMHKKELPPLPKRIGVVTSASGAAYHDITQVISRRYPLCTLVFCPAQVQGTEAVESMIRALRTVESQGNCGLIILGRGGGSLEDLWAFNSPELAKAVYHCKVPVVTGIGHETDTSICDFVADRSAPTPSAAAELATPDVTDLERQLHALNHALRAHMQTALAGSRSRLEQMSVSLYGSSPQKVLSINRQKLAFLVEFLFRKQRDILSYRRQELTKLRQLLSAVNPCEILGRGYAIVHHRDRIVSSVHSLSTGDSIAVQLCDGSMGATVTYIERVKGVGK